MNPLVDLWLAIKVWYLRNLLAAVERHGKYGSADYLQWSLDLLETQREISNRSSKGANRVY